MCITTDYVDCSYHGNNFHRLSSFIFTHNRGQLNLIKPNGIVNVTYNHIHIIYLKKLHKIIP